MTKTEKQAATWRHRTASPYESLVGFLRAVRRGSRIAVSGTAPLDDNGETVAGGAYEQAVRCFEVILEAVEALGGTREDILRTTVFVIDVADWDAVGRAHGEFFGTVFPAVSFVVVRGLLDPRWKVYIDAEAELVG